MTQSDANGPGDLHAGRDTTRSVRTAFALAIVGALLTAPAVDGQVDGSGGIEW